MDYGFQVGDQVVHARAPELGLGTVAEVPRNEQSIHWTNKLRQAA